MSGKNTNDKITTPIVIAISAVLVMVVIVAVALAIHLGKTVDEPNNYIINNRIALPKDTMNKNSTSNRIKNNTVTNNNNIVNNVITNNTAVNNTIANNNIETNTVIEDNNTVVNNKVPETVVSDIQTPSIPEPVKEQITPIKPNIKGKEKLSSGGEMIYVNDYKIEVPKELLQIGYEVAQRDDVFGIRAIDNSYQCIIMQLSDNYVMPTEEEINRFYETEEYKAWDNENYDVDNAEEVSAYMDRYNKISSDYYKSLGYTTKNSPDYTLTSEEKQNLFGKYIREGEEISTATSALFPGYETFTAYDWGATKLYRIPKYYKDSDRGEQTSNLSICIYFFEYYDRQKVRYNVDLSRY